MKRMMRRRLERLVVGKIAIIGGNDCARTADSERNHIRRRRLQDSLPIDDARSDKRYIIPVRR